MKAYLMTTGTRFAFLAVAHVVQPIEEWPRLARDPWFVLEATIGVAAAALSSWAWRLLQLSARS